MEVIPHNYEVEAAVIGALMLDPTTIRKIADLPEDVFHFKPHKTLFKTAKSLFALGKPTDLLTVETWLFDRGLLECDGFHMKQIMGSCVDLIVSGEQVEGYAEILLDKYKRRNLIEAGDRIYTLGLSSVDRQFDDVSAEARAYLENACVGGRKTRSSTFAECLSEVLADIEKGETPGFSTGLADLDGLARLQPKELFVVAGRASMGKTSFGVFLANQFLAKYPLPVLFFSAEMGKEQLTCRFLALKANIPIIQLLSNKISSTEGDKLMAEAGKSLTQPLYIDDTPGRLMTPDSMRAELLRIQSLERSPQNPEGQIGLVILDYLQLLGDRTASNRAQQVGAVSGACKSLAKEFDCPVVALAQINRQVENASNKRPDLSDLKDSGDIEQDADVVVMLYRDEYYNPDTPDRGVAELLIRKNRNGPTGSCKVRYDPVIGSFKNLLS